MQINFVKLSEIVDATMGKLLQDSRLYFRNPDTKSVYIPTPNSKVKSAFLTMADKIYEEIDGGRGTIVLKSCQVADNWRLKHVGKKFLPVIRSGEIFSLPDVCLGPGWQAVFDEWYKKHNGKKIDVDGCDALDICSVAKLTREVYELKWGKENIICLYDGNCDIDHSSPIPKYILANINNAIVNGTMV